MTSPPRGPKGSFSQGSQGLTSDSQSSGIYLLFWHELLANSGTGRKVQLGAYVS